MMNAKTHSMHAGQTLRIYARAAWQHKRDCLLSLLVVLSNVMLGVVMPFLASKILAGLMQPSDKIWVHFYLLIATAAVALASNAIGIRASARMQAKTMYDLRLMVFDRLMRRGAGFYSNQIGGKLVSDALDFISGFGQLANVGFTTALGFASTIVIGLIVIFASNVIIGAFMLALMLVLGIWTYRDNIKRSAIRSARLVISKKATGHLSDSIVNAMTVKTFAQEAYEQKLSEKISGKLKETQIRDWTYVTTNETKRLGLLLLTQIILIFVLIRLTSDNPALLATGIFAFTYTIGIISRFFTIGTMVRQIEEVFLQSSPLSALLSQPDEVQDKPDAPSLEVSDGQIELKDVNFKYADASDEQLVFKDLNLHIEAGEKIGLVGHSGGGKTTLTRLLVRFDDITSGSICIDGQDIQDISQTSLRKNIAYVPQEPLLFHRSIRENIAYGKPEATDEEVEAAAKMAYAHDFIRELPHKYDTIVGERGVKLSGGQRQRVAIARAILKDAPIVILDEATSALDSESEHLIQEALQKLIENRTTVVIAHRLSTIQRMDRILVLEKGMIIEQGPHKDLIKQKGVYASLWNRQSGGFIDDGQEE